MFLVFLHRRYHTLIWSGFGAVEQKCVVFTSTQCHIRLSKFGVVFDTRSGQMCMSFSMVPGNTLC